MADPIYDSKFEVTNELIQQKLKSMASYLSLNIPKGYGFALEIFSFGEGGNFFYISNAQREDILKVLAEWKEKLRTC